jgi:hypothetical protein
MKVSKMRDLTDLAKVKPINVLVIKNDKLYF